MDKMDDIKDNFEQYLKHLDLVQKNEPEKYEFIKEVADSFKDIDLSRLIENTAISFQKYKKEYSEITDKASKEVFLKEQLELYTYAKHRFKRFGDYSNEMYDKYKTVFVEALKYWQTEFNNLPDAAQRKKGFQSKLTDNQIKSLYEQMQGNYFDTSPENFKAIFNQNLTNFTPIKRTKKFNNSLLIYFTSELFQKENPNDYVRITEYCFNVKNLSQSQSNYFNYNNNHKPRGFQEIDKLIKSIYTPLQ